MWITALIVGALISCLLAILLVRGLSDLSKQIREQTNQNVQILQNSQTDYKQSLSQVNLQLGELQQATKQMMEVGQDISSLQDILSSPKLRGGVGEFILADLLQQILPNENYTLQYSFKDNRKVDAVIRLGQALIPIDAKFPLENFKRILSATDENEKVTFKKEFNRDVKKHIDVISNKYILPSEGTYDFAMMYIPAENVYYEAIIKDNDGGESLSEYATRHKIIPVSPNSFYAYLQAILRGLRGMKIESSAQQILERLGQLESDLSRVSVDFDKMGSHLSNAQSSYDRASKSFEKLKFKVQVLDEQKDKEIVNH